MKILNILNVCRVYAASVEVEVVVSEERPRVVMVSTAVCLTLRKDTQALISPLLMQHKLKDKGRRVSVDLFSHALSKFIS